MARRLQNLREETGLPYRRLCPLTGVAYSSLMRWRERLRRGEEAVGTPGPKKLAGLPWETLRQEIAGLRHGRKRTAGTGALYLKYRHQISRRKLREEVSTYRRDLHRRQRQEMERIRWLVPGAVWAMDDTEEPGVGQIHLVQDAASRYKLSVLPEPETIKGKEVAQNLQKLIDQHGPPLALKRDNGGNLNHEEVDEILERNLILPLNSPPYYPRYNGQIERGQREVSETVAELAAGASLASSRRHLWAGLIASELNHRHRPCLDGRTACAVFYDGHERMKRYNRVRRKTAYRLVTGMFVEQLNGLGRWTRRNVDAAWRQAVKTWLLQEGIIAVEQGKSVTPFSSVLVS